MCAYDGFWGTKVDYFLLLTTVMISPSKLQVNQV